MTRIRRRMDATIASMMCRKLLSVYGTSGNNNLSIIKLTMWPCVCVCVWQPTPKTADVTVTKIAGYVRVRILMNRYCFRIFVIHTFYATATLLNI